MRYQWIYNTTQHNTTQHNATQRHTHYTIYTRQDKTRQDKTRQDNTTQHTVKCIGNKGKLNKIISDLLGVEPEDHIFHIKYQIYWLFPM